MFLSRTSCAFGTQIQESGLPACAIYSLLRYIPKSRVTPILESVPRSGKRNQQHSFAELTYLEGFSVEDLLCLRHPDSRIWVIRLRDLLATAHASGTRLLLGNEFDNLGFAAYWLITLSLLNQRLFQATKLTFRPWPL